MAKVAAPGLPSDSLNFCGGSMKVGSVIKRKTPSELRGEQLKRSCADFVDESSAPLENTVALDAGFEKPDHFKNSRYIDTRLDEVYPAKKPRSTLRILSGKADAKEQKLSEESGGMKSLSFRSSLAPKGLQDINSSDESAKDRSVEQCQATEKCSQSRFRSVAELSLGSDRSVDRGNVDMDKALKGLAVCGTSSSLPADSYGKFGESTSHKFRSELRIPGTKVPLDCTLKTALRIISSSPVNWLHRLLTRGAYNCMTPCSSECGQSYDKSFSSLSMSSGVMGGCGLNSWIYPQSSLPSSVISLLNSAGGGAELEFLGKRQLAWEESFRNLYYMLRKNLCDIFYVCTPQFVVMFTAVSVEKTKRKCNAYISQSTRGLRSLLREHDICFSMPLCCSKEEQISREDLVELSEIEKHNLGQTKRVDPMPDVDNSPRSLLAFNGNDGVHGLYDFLLNYRSFFSMLTVADVPVLCSPAPFKNAALSAPEVRCKEIRRVDILQLKGPLPNDGQSVDGSSIGICYSIDVQDAYLPPWVISTLCAAMSHEGRSFEASFTTDPSSLGLNIVLETMGKNRDDEHLMDAKSQHISHPFGTPAVVASELCSASLKGLKFCDGAYAASLSPD